MGRHRSAQPLTLSASPASAAMTGNNAAIISQPVASTPSGHDSTTNIQADRNLVFVHDSTIYVGDTWRAQDNFDTAVKPSGTSMSFDQVLVSGTVDTSCADDYMVTYYAEIPRLTATLGNDDDIINDCSHAMVHVRNLPKITVNYVEAAAGDRMAYA